MQKEAADKEPGVPSKPHCPCTGLLCLLFANKPQKAWPRNQLVPGHQAPGQPPRPGPVWPQHPLRAGDTSPTASPLPPAGTCPCLGTPSFRPSPITLSGERARGLGRTHTEEEEAGPPQPCPQLPWKQKKTPLHSLSERKRGGGGREAFLLLFWVE